MTDFIKTKLAFAVAMLAGLFAAWPISGPLRSARFTVAVWELQVGDFYAAMIAGLALAVYMYGFQLLSERDWRVVQRAGDFTYAISWSVPLIAFVVWTGSLLITLLGSVVDQDSVVMASGWAVAALSTAMSVWVWLATKRSIDRKERLTAVVQLGHDVVNFYSRAKSLLTQRQYDLAVTEAYKSVEVAARQRLYKAGKPPRYGPRVESPLRAAEREGLIPSELVSEVNELRQQRNLAAHAVEPVTRDQARHAVHIAGEVLNALATDDDRDSTWTWWQ